MEMGPSLRKLALTILLLLHQFTAVAGAAKRAAAAAPGAMPEVGRIGVQLVADSALAIVVLVVTTTLGIYKPWGKTRYGRRAEILPAAGASDTPAAGLPLGLKIFLAVLGALVLAFLVAHLAGKGLAHGP